MSDLLARFQAQTRRKADSDLIRRWEWDARYHGDKNIKIQASNAKRSATQMQKIKEQFSNLKPEHELAINAAASALRAMAEELTLLAAWAKDYQVFCAAAWKKEEDARLEALAQERWGEIRIGLVAMLTDVETLRLLFRAHPDADRGLENGPQNQ